MSSRNEGPQPRRLVRPEHDARSTYPLTTKAAAEGDESRDNMEERAESELGDLRKAGNKAKHNFSADNFPVTRNFAGH